LLAIPDEYDFACEQQNQRIVINRDILRINNLGSVLGMPRSGLQGSGVEQQNQIRREPRATKSENHNQLRYFEN